MPARPRARPFRRPAVLRARGKTPPRPPRLWAGQATPMRRKRRKRRRRRKRRKRRRRHPTRHPTRHRPRAAQPLPAPEQHHGTAFFAPQCLSAQTGPNLSPPYISLLRGTPPYFPLMCEIDRGQIKHLSTAPISFQLPKNQSYAPTHQKSELSPSTRLAEKESYAQLTKNTSSDRPAPRGL